MKSWTSLRVKSDKGVMTLNNPPDLVLVQHVVTLEIV
eukprot:CAMPEP_0115283078 /NCGR_PEP_ID=MMETSP0270-20121206/60183_1 /TAXON_ID=71861 /ORGANISM="Scrippsiella trochoidea, Strain CCMP3099" /LENGTH=36 /DNA_ID= /DNA_START= /DNA_END= /DNA_ORIENTATION=